MVISNGMVVLVHIFCFEKYRQYLSLGHMKWNREKQNESVSILCAQAMLSNAMHSMLFCTLIRIGKMHTYEKKRDQSDKKTKSIGKWDREKKHPRNDVISSKDRQWWKSNAMHHWALFHLCVAVVFVISVSFFYPSLYCLFTQFQMRCEKNERNQPTM